MCIRDRDLEKLTLATYFAQLCCELIPENEPAVEELRLMLNLSLIHI